MTEDISPIPQIKKILIVEDDPAIQEVLRSVVEDILEFKALVADDGITGLDQYMGQNPDLILMDMMMPRLDGFSTLARLHEAETPIPIIAVSALNSAEIQDRARSLGCVDFVEKPFDVNFLANKIRTYLNLPEEN